MNIKNEFDQHLDKLHDHHLDCHRHNCHHRTCAQDGRARGDCGRRLHLPQHPPIRLIIITIMIDHDRDELFKDHHHHHYHYRYDSDNKDDYESF